MSARRGDRPAMKLSRRRFVGLVAAGSAVLLATPAAAAEAASRPRRRPAAGLGAKPLPPVAGADEKEFDRQRASTLSALKAIRDFELPPGGDLPVVFRPLPPPPAPASQRRRR